MNHGDHGRRSHAAERSGADTDRLCISSIHPPLDDQGESSLRVICRARVCRAKSCVTSPIWQRRLPGPATGVQILYFCCYLFFT